MKLSPLARLLVLLWALDCFGQAPLSWAEPEVESALTAVAERGSVKVGEVAPNFQLRDLGGNMVTLAQLRGKIVLLNFWATWCGPCRVEMPAMEQLYRTFSHQEFEILAV